MNAYLQKSWQLAILSVLLVLMPLSFCIDNRIKVLPSALLFLAGLGLIITRPATRQSYRLAWPVVAATLITMAFVVFNVLIHHLGWRPLDRPVHVFMYLVIAAVFSLPLPARLLRVGFSIDAIVLGAVCLVQHYGLGIDRAYGLNGGPSASIELATILLGLSLLALIQVLNPSNSRAERAVHAVGVGFGIYGAWLTQSRGPLLAFMVIFAIVVVVHARRTRRGYAVLLPLGGVCLIAAAFAFHLHAAMVTRMEAMRPEVTAFYQHGEVNGSIPERLEMWRLASKALAEHPFIGIGLDRYQNYLHEAIASGNTSPALERFNQPHNEYLNAAATGGILGLLVLLLIFALPLRYFFRHAQNARSAVALPAQAGMAVIGLYMLCALTDSVFYRVMPQSFYFFMISGYTLWISSEASRLAPEVAAGKQLMPARAR